MSGKIDPSWARVTGEVRGFISQKQDGKDVYAPTVDYTVSGQKYTAYGNVFSSFQPDTGEEQEVAYNPAKPDESKVVAGGTTKFVLLIFPAVGALLLFFGITMFVKSILRTRNIDKLVSGGHKLQGVLVDLQTQQSKNGATYQIVVAATGRSGTVQNYVSDPLSGVGGLAMADFQNNPIPIDVYVDPSNPKHYYVDISDIPNLTPERISQLVKMAADKQSQSATHTQPVLQHNEK